VLAAILEQAATAHPQLNHFADSVLSNADDEMKSVIKSIKEQH
jgi:hypothetical protein